MGFVLQIERLGYPGKRRKDQRAVQCGLTRLHDARDLKYRCGDRALFATPKHHQFIANGRN